MKICNYDSFKSGVKYDPRTKPAQSHCLDNQLPEQRCDVEDGTMIRHLIGCAGPKI